MSERSSPAELSPWEAPDLNALDSAEAEPLLDHEARQAIINEAYAEGYAKGHEAGEAAGNALTADRANAFLALLDGIDQPLIQMCNVRDAVITNNSVSVMPLPAGQPGGGSRPGFNFQFGFKHREHEN